MFPLAVPIVLSGRTGVNCVGASGRKNAARGSLPSFPSRYSSIPTFTVPPAKTEPSGFVTLILYTRPFC